MNKEKAIKISIDDFVTKKHVKTAAAQLLRKPNPTGPIDPASFCRTLNNHTRASFKLLMDFKCIVSRQLPKMPRAYITKLLLDGKHESLLAQTETGETIGGVCFRCFEGKDFAEIVFLAVDNLYKDRKVGSQIMNMLKYEMQKQQKRLLLTYADNTALGFFQKQGFERVLETPLCSWNGYIKVYLEGTLMECKIFPELNYSRFSAVLRENKKSIIERIRAFSSFEYSSNLLQQLKRNKKYTNIHDYRYEVVPGLLGAIWSSEQERIFQRQPEFSVILQQLFTVESLRKLPEAHIFRGIKQLPLMVGETEDLETLGSIEKRIISQRSFKKTADTCKKIAKMVQAYKKDMAIGSPQMISLREFEKKMESHLTALTQRKLTIHIDSLYNEKEFRSKKVQLPQSSSVRQPTHT